MGLFVRKGLAVAAGLLLAMLGVGVLEQATGNAAAVQGTWTQSTAEWDVLEAGRDGRSLVVGYRTDSCGERNAHVVVAHESARTVTLALPYEILVYPSAISCPAPTIKIVAVRLHRPIAGRRVLGRSGAVLAEPRAVFGSTGAATEVKAPRVVGLAPADAKHTLDVGYLHGTVQSVRKSPGLTRVAAQTPAAGSLVRRNATVRLRVASSGHS
jgi:hypothetical protein